MAQGTSSIQHPAVVTCFAQTVAIRRRLESLQTNQLGQLRQVGEGALPWFILVNDICMYISGLLWSTFVRNSQRRFKQVNLNKQQYCYLSELIEIVQMFTGRLPGGGGGGKGAVCCILVLMHGRKDFVHLPRQPNKAIDDPIAYQLGLYQMFMFDSFRT